VSDAVNPFEAALGQLVGGERAARMLADEAPGAPGRKVRDEAPVSTVSPPCAASALVGALGLELDHERVLAVAREVLEERGHSAEVVSLRWGVLTVAASAAGGHEISLDRDQVLDALAQRGATSVSQVRVTVTTSARAVPARGAGADPG